MLDDKVYRVACDQVALGHVVFHRPTIGDGGIYVVTKHIIRGSRLTESTGLRELEWAAYQPHDGLEVLSVCGEHVIFDEVRSFISLSEKRLGLTVRKSVLSCNLLDYPEAVLKLYGSKLSNEVLSYMLLIEVKEA